MEVYFYFNRMLVLLVPFLIALTVHEFSHALVATLFGDSTARRMGRLTINPLVHIDILGMLFLFFLGIGWARPVPFDPRYFRYPKLYSVLTALAGPFSNFLVAWFILVFDKHFFLLGELGSFIVYINTMLGVFNLLPLPPLDGGHLLEALLSQRLPHFISWLRYYSLLIIVVFFYFSQTRELFVRLIMSVLYLIESLVP